MTRCPKLQVCILFAPDGSLPKELRCGPRRYTSKLGLAGGRRPAADGKRAKRARGGRRAGGPAGRRLGKGLGGPQSQTQSQSSHRPVTNSVTNPVTNHP